MSQTSYPSASPPSPAKGKTQAVGVAAPSAAKTPKVTPAPAADGFVSSEAIAKRAYEKFVARGGAHGSDQEDWAAAERELMAESRGA